jgi:hypothetical protein
MDTEFKMSRKFNQNQAKTFALANQILQIIISRDYQINHNQIHKNKHTLNTFDNQ